MPRRRTLRKIVAPPNFKSYKPIGTNVEPTGSVDLLYEEYEALRLADYDKLNHEEAAGLMGVSRATFARVYETARQKIARALVETKEIKTVYGNVIMDKNWYNCPICHARFNIPENREDTKCPLCGNQSIELINK